MTVQRTRDYEDPQQRQRRDSDDDTDNEKNDDGPKTAKTTGSDDGDDDTEKDIAMMPANPLVLEMESTRLSPHHRNKDGPLVFDTVSSAPTKGRVWVLVNHISAG